VIAIADVAVRTSAVLLAGLALRTILVRRSAAARHAVLAIAVLCAGLVVPATFVIPAWTIVVAPAARHNVAAGRPDATVSARQVHVANAPVHVASAPAPARRERPLAAVTWAGGFAIGLGVLVIGMIRLNRLSLRGRPVGDARWIAAARSIAALYGLRRDVRLIETDAPFLVATWGLRPARVLLPPGACDWTDARIRAVLCHELAHVARGDWAVQIAARVVLAALWFNPLAWIACRLLRRESEQACDDAVLGRGVAAADYAGHLVALARDSRRRSWAFIPALPMARRSAFERRIAVMLNPRVDRTPVSRRVAVACASALTAVTLAAAAVHAIQAPAALSGTVYDPTGGVMPGVAVTLEDAQQHSAQATTDSSGRFAFPGIGSGRYVLSAALPGFKTLRDTFDLKNSADWDRAVTLQVGTLQETITVSAGRLVSGGVPSSTGTLPVRVRVGGNIRVPKKTLDVRPVYPTSMRVAGREGQVPIEATIGPDGSVSSVRVLSAQVHPDFAIAAVDAVRQWRFTPTLLNGQPVEVVMTVTVQFSLSD
jgi:TonB family protein